MRNILSIQGYADTTKTLGEIIQELNKEERFLYQNNDEGRKEIIDMLRQRSRPYLFSNTLAPSICAGTLKAIEILQDSTELRDTLEDNTHYFRKGMQEAGFDVDSGDHPIVPVMLGDANLAQTMSQKLLEHGIYAIGFFYPVVPKGKARIRTQISAAHSKEDLDKAIKAFATIRDELKS